MHPNGHRYTQFNNEILYMEKTIKEITRLLLQGTLTKDEADKILFDVSCSMGKPHDAYIKLENGEEYRVYVDPETYHN